jgi:hypothetical protein
MSNFTHNKETSNIAIKIHRKIQKKERKESYANEKKKCKKQYHNQTPVLLKCLNNTCFVGESTSDSEDEDDDGERISSSPNNSPNTLLGAPHPLPTTRDCRGAGEII